MSREVFSLIVLIVSFILSLYHFVIILNLKKRVSKIEKKSKAKPLPEIEIGNRVLHSARIKPSGAGDDLLFNVLYEVEVISLTSNKAKVRGIGFKCMSSSAFGQDPINAKAILKFIDDTWLDISSLELVLDDSVRRDKKINSILE